MLTIRRSNDRGHAHHGWLDARHTFSFASYRDAAHMGFRSLRVINEDRIAASQGFGMHGHEDMEIISYVLDGALAHKDSLGNEGVITPGEFQYMSAGSGVHHAEFNGSDETRTHLLQIWILPDRRGGEPRYGQTLVADDDKTGAWAHVAGPARSDARFSIKQDARLLVGRPSGQALAYDLQPERGAWIQVVRGPISVNGTELASGDGASIEDVPKITVTGEGDAEVLLFDMA